MFIFLVGCRCHGHRFQNRLQKVEKKFKNFLQNLLKCWCVLLFTFFVNFPRLHVITHLAASWGHNTAILYSNMVLKKTFLPFGWYFSIWIIHKISRTNRRTNDSITTALKSCLQKYHIWIQNCACVPSKQLSVHFFHLFCYNINNLFLI